MFSKTFLFEAFFLFENTVELNKYEKKGNYKSPILTNNYNNHEY